jgi:5-methylcytosine-specific restriction endonuclease McrA
MSNIQKGIFNLQERKYFPMTDLNKDKQHIAREKLKARELRKSQWWKNEIAKGNCHYCGNTFKPKELTMEHVVPLSRGGKSTKGNIVPSCKDCNNKKKYMTPVDMVLKILKEEKK